MRTIFFAFFSLLITINVLAQSSLSYLVSSQTLNMRNGPSTDNDVILKLSKNDAVKLVQKNQNGWWLVSFDGTEGFVYSDYLRTSQKDSYEGWEKTNYQSGVTPDCENVNPKYDYKIDNYLKVNVGSNTDVVIKLMKISSFGNDICSRIVYVRSGEKYNLKNIPEGRYYLKLAYGKDYRQKIIDNQCYVKFMKNSQYEKGSEILSFHKIKQPDEKVGDYIYESWDIPSFELSLDVIVSKYATDDFQSNDISEEEFNK